jgi:hypothetical protein
MSLTSVRSALAGIVAGTPGLSRVRGLPASFKHEPEAGARDEPGDARRFYFALDAMAGAGRYTPGGVGNRRRDTLRLVVIYPADNDDAAIEDAISDDYDAISARLLDSALWAGTPIVDVVVTEPFLPAEINGDSGALALSITLTVEHTR